MGMFDTVGTAASQAQRKENTLRKLERMKKTLRHEEPDRVPVSDFFWGGFMERWRKELGLPADANPYFYYDLDWIVTVSNMDPWIRPFETIKETQDEVVVKTGYGAIMRKLFRCPMPEFIGWETDTLEKLEAAEFDDPRDPRRYFSAGDNQIAGVGDGFERNSPPWIDTVKSLWPDFPVYGSITECSECMTRMIGPQNHMMWIALEPERMAAVLRRVGQFYLDCAKAAIDAAGPWLDGFVDLGRRGVQEEHVHAAGVLAGELQALGQGDRRLRPLEGARCDLPRLRQCQFDLPGLHRLRHRRHEPAGGEGQHGRPRSAAAVRPPHGLLRQQQHSGMGIGRPRRDPT